MEKNYGLKYWLTQNTPILRSIKKLVKEEQIKIELLPKSFEFFNTDRTKNRKVTQFVSLELEINRYIKNINIAVMDLNSIDIFLEYNWLVKHNLEVNWDINSIEEIDKEYQKIGKELDPTDPEDLPEYI